MPSAPIGPDRVLGTTLYAASQYHARRARALVAATDEHERLDAAAHAGAALELIAKALLADVDVCLLPDRPHHTLLDALVEQRQGLSPRRSTIRTTVGATLAVELAARLVPGCRKNEQSALRVIKARNAAVHMATAPTTEELADLVSSMQAFSDAAATELRGSSRDYWGAYFDEVTRERAASDAALTNGAAAKVTEARARYAHAIGSLPVDLRDRVLTELRTRLILVGEEMGTVECPACGEAATTVWETDVEVEEELPGDYLYHPYLALLGMGCPVCGLKLDPSEMSALKLDPEEPDPTPDDEFDRDI